MIDRRGHLVKRALGYGVGDLGVHRCYVLAAGEPDHSTGRRLRQWRRLVNLGESLGQQDNAPHVDCPPTVQFCCLDLGQWLKRGAGVCRDDDVESTVSVDDLVDEKVVGLSLLEIVLMDGERQR